MILTACFFSCSLNFVSPLFVPKLSLNAMGIEWCLWLIILFNPLWKSSLDQSEIVARFLYNVSRNLICHHNELNWKHTLNNNNQTADYTWKVHFFRRTIHLENSIYCMRHVGCDIRITCLPLFIALARSLGVYFPNYNAGVLSFSVLFSQ